MLVLDDNVLVFLVYLLKFYRDGLNEQSGFPISRIKMPRKRHAPIPTSSILRLFELLYKRVYKFYATGFFSAFLALNFSKLGPFSLKKKMANISCGRVLIVTHWILHNSFCF